MKTKIKPIKAWAVILDGIQAVGNGNEFQYPIFPTKDEAENYSQRENYWLVTKVIPVLISPIKSIKK